MTLREPGRREEHVFDAIGIRREIRGGGSECDETPVRADGDRIGAAISCHAACTLRNQIGVRRASCGDIHAGIAQEDLVAAVDG